MSDLIERSEVLKQLWLNHKDVIYIDKVECAKRIKAIPSARPKEGKWIDKGWHGDWQFETDGRGNCWHEYECSECRYRKRGGKSNFCPDCGADMTEREGE